MTGHKRFGRSLPAVIATTAIMSLGLAACGNGGSGTGSGGGDLDQLRVVSAIVPTSLDADSTNINDIYTNYQIAAQYMSPLVRIRPTDDSDEPLTFAEDLQPELAESFEVSDKGVTFVLREDAVSPAGNKVTSKDVQWTFERIAANGAVGALLLGIANVDMENPVTVVDERTVTINLSAPSSLLLPVLDNAAIGILDSAEAEKHATEKDPWAAEWLKTNTASFGPYGVAAFKPGEEVTLDGNSNYWDGEPSIDSVTLRSVPEAASRAQLLQTSSADLAMGVPPVEWAALGANDKVITQALDSPNALQIWVNTTKAPMSNPDLRLAVSTAVNRQDIADGLFPGVGTPADGCSAATIPVDGFTLGVPLTGDTAEATALVESAGLDKPLLMIYNSAANVFSETAARLVQDQLKGAGIEVQLKGYATQAEYQAAMDKREWDMNLGVQGLFVNHPLYELKMFLTGDSSLNIPAYMNDGFTELVDNALASTGDDAIALTAEACDIAFNKDVPAMTLMNYPYTLAASNAVSGIRSYPYDRIHFADLS